MADGIRVADGQTPLQPSPGEPESLLVTLDTGDRVHYLDWGGPAAAATQDGRLPPMLLLHGLGQTAWSWAPVARRLCRLTRVIAMDLRGHGLSDSPRKGYELSEQAFDALTVMSANGWGADVGGPPAAVAGHGFGAMVAVTMAVLRPASVAALALVDAGWENVAETTGQSPDEFERGLGDPPEVLASMDSFLADRRDYDPDSWDADQERAARATVDQTYAGHVKAVARPHVIRGCVSAIFDYRPEETVARAVMPVLVAVAGADTADDEEGRLRRLALADLQRVRRGAGLAEARVVNFAGAGHNLMRYRPAELGGALAGLLETSRYQRS
jgi:pimeloyl-ACP methyl ester carboxylesterase